MSKMWLAAVLLAITVVGGGMMAVAYYRAQDFAPTYFALYISGISIITFGGHAAIRRYRTTSKMRSTTAAPTS